MGGDHDNKHENEGNVNMTEGDHDNKHDHNGNVNMIEGDIPFHCANTSSQYDEKWQPTLANTQATHNCTEVLCTRNADASLTIGSIPNLGGQMLQVVGLWNGVLFPGQSNDGMGIFTVLVDNNPVNRTQNNLRVDLSKNRFYITPDLNLNTPNNGPHTFTFTNEQTRVGLCIVGARFQEAPLSTNSSTTPSIPAVSSPSNSDSATSPTSTQSGSGKSGIAIAAVIPILTIISLFFVTLYLRRRWRRRPIGTPEHLRRMKLDDIEKQDEDAPLSRAGNHYSSTLVPSPPDIQALERPNRPNRRYFASFTLSSVSSIPQPPPSVDPPSTVSSRASIFERAQASLQRFKTVRKELPAIPEDKTRRGVLRAVNISDE